MPKKKSNKKMLFVINPISGDNDKISLEKEIKALLKPHSVDTEFYYTTGKNDRESISEIIDEINPSTVVAIGGDGTCNLVAQTALHTPIKIGIVPLGSANGMATELNLPTDLEESLKLILAGKTRSIDVLRINKEHISLHLSDLGFNGQLIDVYEKGETRGLLSYAKSFIDNFGNAAPAKFEIVCNGKNISKEAFMVVLANASKFGTGAVINPLGKPDDGYFEIVVMRPQNFMHFLEMLVPFYTSKIHTLDFVDTYKCQRVKIKNQKKQSLQIDGEKIGQPLQVDVEILPRSLEVIVP
ncbi:YegS/Rv2252/BmrU family lipid kinase [Maribellus comscasis]|uniref:YegS/Rv2252/BmrU family lipid kinase n=1 Tax=Maribellus comscasis TaxID=2681766 RepID=A0A6I6K2I6_9BACT|nr:diacylglycerol kinase family protein [Maribellus comscasis]QGY47668.1 YegS/Rv2252/BmrU family lipid kinase [Maribellus comscasis]